jgi:type IV pilus assembly protein PilW
LYIQAEYKGKYIMQKQKGLSLIELMIAITLGLILLTGVMQVFLSSKTVFSTQQSLSRIQETGRLAIEFLSRDIRMAGYMGCASRSVGASVANTLNTPTAFLYAFNESIRGYTAATVPGSVLSKTPKANTDLFVIRGGVGSSVKVTQNNDSDFVIVSKDLEEAGACSDSSSPNRISGVCKGDIVIISDCTKARVFQVSGLTVAGTDLKLAHSSAGLTPGNLDPTWGGASGAEAESFKPGAELMVAATTVYFIADNLAGVPSLWQSVNGGTSLELLEGVENMSIKYGVDTSGTPDYIPDAYVAAGAVVNWNRVVSVRVELLIRSLEDNVVPEVQKYHFDGVSNVTPNPVDRRLRQVFTTTIGIRSRLF